ncbi:MAG TPA: ATP-dependent DNA ligase [candidate division Zixibacteria bacterium]|nr:ATP-dependent DNA ligase [candidate division Zixibacteria bacterium]
MKYSILADTYKKLDSTTKRLEMIDILMDLFDKTPKEVFREVIYLTSGKIGADYEDLELGFADKMVIKAIAKTVGRSEDVVSNLFKSKGDLGEVAEELMAKTGQQHLGAFFQTDESKSSDSLDVKDIWESFQRIAEKEGKGSSDKKTKTLIGLFTKATPLEAKYITRTILSQLRLGVKDLTIIEALSRKFGEGEKSRKIIEHAYNVTSDIGEVGEVLVRKGISGVKEITIKVGRPIRMMAAQRMLSAEEILEKLGGKCALEFKYDGERVQAHISKDEIALYSRNLNEISSMYPDVQKALRTSINSKDVILEGEITAWNPDTGKLKSFQILMSRKRKYDIDKVMEEVPVKVFLFDILYLNGESLLDESYPNRRKILESIVRENNVIVTASQEIVSSPEAFENYFEIAIENGCEGIMAKDIRPASQYQAGNRGFLWIKHKFDYTSAFVDSFDFVVIGGFYGKGRRKGTLGTLLMAAFNPELERFETVCKLGSGFSDEELSKLTEELLELKIERKPKDVFSKMEPDVWIDPIKVLEIQGADLSTSPIHTCALDEIKKDFGIAIRFPRFIRFRDDKSPEFATTTNEVIYAYKNQRSQK